MKELCSRYLPRATNRRQESAPLRVTIPYFSRLRYPKVVSFGIIPCIKRFVRSGAEIQCNYQNFSTHSVTVPLEISSSVERQRLNVRRISGTSFARLRGGGRAGLKRSGEHTSELQSLRH